MAQLAELFGDCPSCGPFAVQPSNLPQQLDRLLLTVPSVCELYSRLGEFLLKVVAVDAVWLGSPDDQGKVRCHFTAGAGVEEYLAAETIRIDEHSDSPLARAWRTASPQFALDWTDDREPLPSAFWRERGLRFGWRSSCAIPISGAAGKRDILVLYSKRPRFFGAEHIRQFVLQLHGLLGFALERLRLLETMEQSQQALMLYKNAMDLSNALHRALMGTAELVVRAQTEQELLAELCRLLVDGKLFAQVWIGKPNAVGDLEILSIYSATGVKHVPYLPNVLTGDEEGILAVRAWRSCQLQFTNDRLTDSGAAAVQNFYKENCLHAAAVVPLYRNGKIWALLTLLSHESNIFTFTPEVLELVERIGRLVGHGLDAVDLRHALEEERKYQAWLARHDPLTDLLNRRGLTERVEEAITRSREQHRSMAVALVDLNGFRVLNELHGHPACDLLLRTAAERLQAPLRPGDAVGRLGGDEFALILEDVDEEKLAVLLPQVQAAVEGPMELANGRTATIRTSIGVTVFPQDNSTPEHLLRHADRALYTLKESGAAAASRWAMFRAEADEQKRTRQTAVLGLFSKGNLRVHYQPLVNLQTGEVRGIEALARLVDSDGKILPPADFLGHFGAVELTALTSQVLSQGIDDLHRLDKAGFYLSIGINLEPLILNDPKSVAHLRQKIQSSGLTENRIVLELLEHTDTLSMNGAQETLRDLKACGARIALDDVGSAYSSLLRMKEFPVDIVKLDRSFLTGLDRQPKELRFLMNLANLAQSQGLDLVAEGVENDASRDALAALGVKYAQGYAIAMPMAADELEKWLQSYKPAPWVRPRTVLGVAALQLIGLDATARILPQRPDYLEYMQTCDADNGCEIGRCMNELGQICAEAATAHRAFHATLARHAGLSSGIVQPSDFQAARIAYEEALFRAVQDASSI